MSVEGGPRGHGYLFFYSARESLLILIQWKHAHAGECVCVYGLYGTCMGESVDSFTCALGTSCSAESRGKLCRGTASELLKQSSADKPRILSPREKARA